MISAKDRLFLPSIGFRARSAIRELTNLREKRSYQEFILEDVYKIAFYCESALNREASITMLEDAYFSLMLGDLDELMKNQDGTKILRERIAQVKHAKSTLEKITKKEEVSQNEIEGGINFFEELSKRCREQIDIYDHSL